jgi:hypothetical protein
MEARPPRRGGRNTIEAETGEIERIDEGTNDVPRQSQGIVRCTSSNRPISRDIRLVFARSITMSSAQGHEETSL